MHDISYWQKQIQEKRKDTEFRDFIEEIWSWFPIVFHKYNTLLSRHPESNRIWWIVTYSEFEESRWSLQKVWRGYDFTKTFQQNFWELIWDVELANLVQFENNENSEYWDIILGSKNIYLSIVIVESENVMYSNTVLQSKNVYRSFLVEHWSENVYNSKCISESQSIFYSKYIKWAYNLWFCSDCIWSKDCLFCEWLDNAQYCIKNKQFSQEEYEKEKDKILLDYSQYDVWYESLRKTGRNIACHNVTGNYNISCEDVENGFLCRSLKDSRNAINSWTWEGKFERAYDVISAWELINSDFYWVMWAGMWSSHLYCSSELIRSNNIYYSYFLQSCDHMFGCVWMSNASYCILNKQYEKDEWYALISKIFSQMEQEWVLGKMIPPYNNPFYFNDTFAWLVWDYKKEDILKKWYLWREEHIKTWIPEWNKIIQSRNLGITNYSEDILNIIIESTWWDFYRIMPMELNFFKKYNLPLPTMHWKDTMKLQMSQ